MGTAETLGMISRIGQTSRLKLTLEQGLINHLFQPDFLVLIDLIYLILIYVHL